MEATFWFKTRTLRQIQRIVGLTDARFIGNPIAMGDRAYVSLNFDRCSPKMCAKFSALAEITQQPFF